MDNNLSEIDDKHFFFAKDGKTNPKSEMAATIKAFYEKFSNEENSSICRFPARYIWLKKELNGTDFPKAHCPKYEKILNRVDPTSTTLVFPSAHINSPASMFGHTFLRINSSYNSKLLSYAVNYAANANTETENGVVFAIKGLMGGYFGKYSLLPYYEKLKEYKDGEQRDIWEYNLDLTKDETMRMFRHIWELNGTNSYYYFFTENCSYNMLWLIESARPSLHLRKKFHYQVIPLETVHVAKEAGIISGENYRPSKRTILLKYEKLIKKEYLDFTTQVVDEKLSILKVMNNKTINKQQKRYILEAAIEYLEYQLGKGKIPKKEYLTLFHQLTTIRATLGNGLNLNIKTPPNPINSHRAVRLTVGFGTQEGDVIYYLGIRPAYHDLEDSNYGFLRGTQIEFMNLLFSMKKDALKVEKATIISIASLAQRSEFFHSFSWRMHLGWDNNSLSQKTYFNTSVGAGYSWGNEIAFMYALVDPLVYVQDGVRAGIGGSIGLNIDKYKLMNANFEATQRIYDNGVNQTLLKASLNIRTTQNTQIILKYDYKDKIIKNLLNDEQTMRIMLNYYF